MKLFRTLNVYYFISGITLLAATACQEEDFGFESEEIAYETAFVKQFGKPAANHNWGFVDIPIVDYTAAQTRASINTNSNEWESVFKLNVPQAVTDEEAQEVYKWFSENQNPTGQVIHWEDFFIQFVYCQQSNMNELQVKCLDGSIDHINNYNNSTKAIQYVYDAGTESWSYASTASTGKYYRQWDLFNIQFLSFEVNGHHYEGWYLGFDYESLKEGEQGGIPRDGFYNDWIVKITPGTHQNYPVTVRVMCEDLGNSFDWDFNDVVFDVTFFKSPEEYWPVPRPARYCATIVLRSVGGTLPIYVGTMDENYEAHKLLGDGSMTPLVRPGKIALYSVELDQSGFDPSKNTANAKSIPIYVRGAEATYKIESSGIPQKFACPDNVEWADEQENICDLYPNIPAWVTNPSDPDLQDAANVWKYNPKK